jgi:putative glutamine amidotransferase
MSLRWVTVNDDSGRPLIGMTAGTPLSYNRVPCYAANQHYVTSLRAAGADVVVLPAGAPVPARLLERLDGILFPGGVDVDPASYGEEARPELGAVDPELDALELPLVRAAVDRGLPVLGICRGQQVVNVALGGTLYQDLSAAGVTRRPHHAPLENGRDYLDHEIAVVEGSHLASIVGADRLRVNSFHHQAVRRLAPSLTVGATSPDGVIEATESADGRVLTLQCHPESLSPSHAWAQNLFKAFVRAAAGMPEPVVAATPS